ncbi:ExbD/TolR family protein [Sediminibacterium soli]|uniref:ExbD/TolR family protein n=1 Tax=Sediminibacterium soli TaxID=2698829 RepID=UPI00137ABC23|nr:biopolymer transporter ExbD [Sediminibacterium soli]NCI47443.1 biopolymer transporter ExbD [Sediminibacterium soli]
MGRAKLPRKSTNIDMTAMCDVAFLLLSFFILTTKFKPSEAIEVKTPNSVSSKVAPSENFVQVILDKDGKVFIAMDKADKKELIANALNTTQNLGLDVNAFKNAEFFGAPLGSMASFLKLAPEAKKGSLLPGIPVKDSANNELVTWMRVIKEAYTGEKEPAYLLKGDNFAKYPAFKAIITAFKKNDILKFQMITNPEGAPVGTDLWKKGQAGEKSEE